MKLKLIPKSDPRLEKKLGWRVFKTAYFILGSIGAGLTYSLLNGWYYVNCPIHLGLPWEEEKKLCTELFAWDEMLAIMVTLFIALRIIFPLVEKIALYIAFNEEKGS